MKLQQSFICDLSPFFFSCIVFVALWEDEFALSLFVKNCTVASRIIPQVVSPFLFFSISLRSPKAAIDLATVGILFSFFYAIYFVALLN